MRYHSVKLYCLICGEDFLVVKSRSKEAKYCSGICYGKSRLGNSFGLDKKITKECLICKKSFRTSPCRKLTAKYCSIKCRRRAQGNLVAREKNYGWKGGRWINKLGYVVINLGKNNYQYEHRFFMEKHLGRPLKSWEDVHHIDGDKTNNSLDNLLLLKHKSHSKLHTLRRWMEGNFR